MAPCSERLLDGIECRIGIKARIAVCQKALQSLINQLPIGVCEIWAHVLGSDRIQQGLDQLQPFCRGRFSRSFTTSRAGRTGWLGSHNRSGDMRPKFCKSRPLATACCSMASPEAEGSVAQESSACAAAQGP